MLQTYFYKLKIASVSGVIMAALALFAANATAITPSPAMLEQLKQIPKSEQQRVVRTNNKHHSRSKKG